MIELIYNEEEETAAEEQKLPEPKNVKQVGEPREYKKIFIEDYVHTFLTQYSAETGRHMTIAVLLGNRERSGGIRHFYIQSAMPVEGVTEKQGIYVFSEKLWSDIYQKCEEYFPGQEIMGWFLSKPGFSIEKTAAMEETHRTYFSGADKFLFTLEPVEGESGFFGFDGNRFSRQPGYYVYYEKNEPMREFIMKEKQKQEKFVLNEKPDIAMANFRKILQEKQDQNEKRKKQMFSYGLGATALLAVFAGAVLLNSQRDPVGMSKPEEVLETAGGEVVVEELSGNVEQQPEVETIPDPEMPDEELPVSEEVSAEQPKEEEPAEEEPAEEAATETVYEEYIVEPGDTLAKISRNLCGSEEMVDQICELNGIEDGDYIQAGEIILLP